VRAVDASLFARSMEVFSVHAMLATISRFSREEQLQLFKALKAKLKAEGGL
jgi:hypothetical protein